MACVLHGLLHDSWTEMEEHFVIISTELSRHLWLSTFKTEKERAWRSEILYSHDW